MVKKQQVHEYGNGITWSRRHVLGQGYFGRVFLATADENCSSMNNDLPPLIAVKSVKDVIRKEREVYRKIKDCPYIVRCFGEETTYGENGEIVYNLLLEYCSGGTLKQKIINSEGGLPEIEARYYTRSILRGIYHIHCLRYVHRDLKPDNILLVPTKGGRFDVKICDFGLSKSLSEDVRYWEGTPKFLPPEAMISDVQGAPADIWAVGCLVLEMLTGKPVWDDRLNDDEIIRKVGFEGECPYIPDEISEKAKDFLNGCFQRDPVHRSTAEFLLRHPFIGDFSDDDIVENNNEFDDVNYDDDMIGHSQESDDQYEVDDNNDAIEDDYYDAIGEKHDDKDLKEAEYSILLKRNRFFTWFAHYSMLSRFWRRE